MSVRQDFYRVEKLLIKTRTYGIVMLSRKIHLLRKKSF